MTIYSSINRGIYGHVAGAQLYSRNIFEYIGQRYIPQFIHRLTEEYKLYSSV
jgi:hypothetical protein